jgi:hypothetical protein
VMSFTVLNHKRKLGNFTGFLNEQFHSCNKIFGRSNNIPNSFLYGLNFWSLRMGRRSCGERLSSLRLFGHAWYNSIHGPDRKSLPLLIGYCHFSLGKSREGSKSLQDVPQDIWSMDSI